MGKEEFFADAKDVFGGIAALPTHTSAATMEQVAAHLKMTTDNASVDGLRELVQQASGRPEPTVQGVLSSLLKFQGIKVSQSGAGTAHSHGHLSVDMDDLSECTSRISAAVSASLKRVGMEASPGGGMSSKGREDTKASALSRLSTRLRSATSAGEPSLDWGGGDLGGAGGTEIQFGGGEGSGGLFLSPG